MGRYEEASSGYSSSDDEVPYQVNFKGRHRCTDIPCCIIFAVAVVAFAGVCDYAINNGDVRKLEYGRNAEGLVCGVDHGVADKPYVYYCPQEDLVAAANISTYYAQMHIAANRPVCLAECPQRTTDAFNVSTLSPPMVLECGVAQAYPTMPFHRVCLPISDLRAAQDETFWQLQDFWEELSADNFGLDRSWPVMVQVVIVAIFAGYAYLFLLRWAVRCLIWPATIVSCIACIWFAEELWQAGDPDKLRQQMIEDGATDVDVDEATAFLLMSAVFMWFVGIALALLVCCLMCCAANAIRLSIACIQSAMVVMWKMPTMMVAPFVKVLLKVTVYVVFLGGFLHMVALGEVHGTGFEHKLTFTPAQTGLIVFYVFTAFWILEFISAAYMFCLAWAVATYYHTPDGANGYRRLPFCNVLEGLWVGLVKHSGTFAFGSLLIALLKVLQQMLSTFHRSRGCMQSNSVTRACFACQLCVCNCLEGILKFVNKNVYVDVVLTSNSFCGAARSVMHVVIEHGAAIAFLNFATFFFQIIGMVAITALCGAITWHVLKTENFSDIDSDYHVEFPEVTTAIACIIAFIVSWAFMSIFDVTVDTLLYCYAEDRSRNGGQVTTAPAEFVKLYDEADVSMEDRMQMYKRSLAQAD